MSNVLDAISKLKLNNSKNHFSNLVLYLPAYSWQVGLRPVNRGESLSSSG